MMTACMSLPGLKQLCDIKEGSADAKKRRDKKISARGL